MVTLKGLHLAVTPPESSDPLGGCNGRSRRGDIGHLILDRSLADIRIIIFAQLAARCIDDQLNLLVLNPIYDIRPAFLHLPYGFGFDAVFGQEAVRPFGCPDLEAKFVELPGSLQNSLSVLLRYCD